MDFKTASFKTQNKVLIIESWLILFKKETTSELNLFNIFKCNALN